jgi:hypothetical protein
MVPQYDHQRELSHQKLIKLDPQVGCQGHHRHHSRCGKMQLADISTKEMRNSANLRCFLDSFMCRAHGYLKGIHNIAISKPFPCPVSPSPDSTVLAQSTHYIRPTQPGILDILISYPSLHLPPTLLCISNAGRHILSNLAPSFYMQALMSNPMGGVSTELLITSYCLLVVRNLN